ncbi:flagellar protein [Planococcus lenghuensis]|uniref:flagellar protein n=1 Tax=Planococcus lenghuensis TaxID=2213202 RepID=UPI001E382596|nr:flagellar protein [Planococcus lenghuensis]
MKDHTDYCLNCFEDIEQDFKYVADFLKKEQNRYATLQEVSKAAEVSEKRIMEFIRGGRIFAEDYPNLGYECAQCGTLIKRQVLCNDCYERYSTAVDEMMTREKAKDEIRKAQHGHQNEAQYWRLKRNK